MNTNVNCNKLNVVNTIAIIQNKKSPNNSNKVNNSNSTNISLICNTNVKSNIKAGGSRGGSRGLPGVSGGSRGFPEVPGGSRRPPGCVFNQYHYICLSVFNITIYDCQYSPYDHHQYYHY